MDRHSVLSRQLKRCNLNESECPQTLEQWHQFLDRINRAYTDLDQDRYLLQRSQEISSLEMNDLYRHLTNSEKMATIGQLAAGIAHEINNPLSYVLSNIDILSNRFNILLQLLQLHQNLMANLQIAQTQQLQEICNQIAIFNNEKKIFTMSTDFNDLIGESQEGLLRIKKIVLALKHFAGTGHEEKEKININSCIESAIEIVWGKLKNQCSMHKNLLDVPEIIGYPNQLLTVFINLLLNAVESVTDNGEITVFSNAVDSHILIGIADNGCGILPDNLSNLFTPFFTTKTMRMATGLGLAMAHGIVQTHGGTITVESRVGHGSTFTVRLPINYLRDKFTEN